MKKETLSEFETKLKEYNRKNNPKSPIRHINTTFEELINAIQATIDDRDYKMQDVLDDYLNYCYKTLAKNHTACCVDESHK